MKAVILIFLGVLVVSCLIDSLDTTQARGQAPVALRDIRQGTGGVVHKDAKMGDFEYIDDYANQSYMTKVINEGSNEQSSCCYFPWGANN